jgi:hypothetical protein
MAKDAMVRARTKAELKEGLPFEIKIPNDVTRRTFEDTA